MRLPFLAATGALAEGLEPTVSERVGKSPAVGGVEGVEIWFDGTIWNHNIVGLDVGLPG